MSVRRSKWLCYEIRNAGEGPRGRMFVCNAVGHQLGGITIEDAVVAAATEFDYQDELEIGPNSVGDSYTRTIEVLEDADKSRYFVVSIVIDRRYYPCERH